MKLEQAPCAEDQIGPFAGYFPSAYVPDASCAWELLRSSHSGLPESLLVGHTVSDKLLQIREDAGISA